MTIKRFKSKFLVNANHLSALCRRYVLLIASDRMALLTLIFQAPVMLVIISLACSKEFTYAYATTTMFVISATCVIMATLNSYREICKERDVLIRETNAGLDSTAYILSKVLIQGIICLFQAIVLVTGTSLIFPFNISGFFSHFQYFLMTYLILLSSTCIGLFISAVLKNSDRAILPVLFIIIAQVVLSGAPMIPLPSECEFLSYFVVTRWGLGGYSHIFDFATLSDNAMLPVLNPIFKTPMIVDVMVLVCISFLCIIFSVVAVNKFRKRKY